MNTDTATKLIWYFSVYSVLGWMCEVVYCSAAQKKLVRRGFLAGPYCPIYGFGAVAVLALISPLAQRLSGIPAVFLLAVFITSALEYLTSFLMEKIFSMRWWDYSHMKFNIKGRICLLNSVLFGLLSLFLLYVLHPIVSGFVGGLSVGTLKGLSSLFVAVFLIDLLTTLNDVYKLNEKLRAVAQTFGRLEVYEQSALPDARAGFAKLEEFAAKAGEEASEIVRRLRESLDRNSGGRRLLRSFDLRHVKLPENLELVKQYSELYKGNFARFKADVQEYFVARKAERELAAQERETSFQKLFWIFFVGSVAGYIAEIIYCFVTRGYLESRQGLIYGPFSQVYGVGAVLMVLVMNKLGGKTDRQVFLGSAIIGGVFEALCSYFQELVFGSTSWDYTGLRFSFFGGRTNLLFMFFWGILGVIFVKEIHPKLSRFMARIPSGHSSKLTRMLILFMSLNIALTCAAVSRWSKREHSIPAQNRLEEFLDREYGDEFMAGIYPNMVFEYENTD